MKYNIKIITLADMITNSGYHNSRHTETNSGTQNRRVDQRVIRLTGDKMYVYVRVVYTALVYDPISATPLLASN